MAGRVENFIDFIDYSKEKDYMMNLITYAISPTIAGHKPSSIISISNTNKGMYDLWCKYGDEYIDNINLKVFEISRKNDVVILLFYNEDMLSEIVFHKDNMEFLLKFGYSNNSSLDMCLQLLKDRYQYIACPHEVGIFLGIPVRDVEAFINCDGKECLLCGYWKVYHDREKALEIFKNYDNTRESVVRMLKLKINPIDMIGILSSNKILVVIK